MPDGPYADRAAFEASLKAKAASEDPLFYAILDAQSARALGHASYLRMEPKHRVIEVGSIMFSPALQRTRAATEASDAQWAQYLFFRDNPKGVHLERWRHAYGCGLWFNLARHTVTHEVLAVYPISAAPPPLPADSR